MYSSSYPIQRTHNEDESIPNRVQIDLYLQFVLMCLDAARRVRWLEGQRAED